MTIGASVHTVTVLGATGYAGREIVKLLLGHPDFQLAHVTTTSRPGTALASVHPELTGRTGLVLEPYAPGLAAGSDALVSCSPHHESMTTVAEALDANPHLKVVDLSADFRLPDADLYESVYGTPHEASTLLAEAAYGLPEIFRDRIRGARLVANPGCYPTSALIPLAPLARAGLLEEAIIDSVSGLSGAGATPSAATHFAKADGSVTAYKVGTHRHGPEIAVQLAKACGGDIPVTFTPHLVPMERGIHSTIHAFLNEPVTADQAASILHEAYASEPFVRLLGPREPDTKWTLHSNFVDVGWHLSASGRRIILLSALDNLGKGAAGQAVQNLNLLFGHPETTGFGMEAARIQVNA